MPLWLLLLVALFLVVAAVALIISIHILETHASQCLALDAAVASNKETPANPGMAASADHTCCMCGGHRKGSTDVETLPGASKTSGGGGGGVSIFQPLSDVAFGKSTACSAADCLSGLTSRRTGTASGLRSGWLKTSRCFVGGGGGEVEHQDEHLSVASATSVAGSAASGANLGVGATTVAAASSSFQGSPSCATAVASSSVASSSEGSVSSQVAAAMTSEGSQRDDFACVAEASAGSWGTCGSSATATITATITATPSATASGSSAGGASGGTGSSAGKQPPSRRLILEILMAPSHTPDGQGGSLPRATGVRLKLETNGGAETLQNLAQLTGGSVGGDGTLTITGADEIAALGLNAENIAEAQKNVQERSNAAGAGSGATKGATSAPQTAGVTAINSKSAVPKEGGVSLSSGAASGSASGRGGKAGDVNSPPVGKSGQGQRSAAGAAQKGAMAGGSPLNSKAAASGLAEGKGWEWDDHLNELEDPRAKKVAEEVAARKADMEVVLAAARATAAARKTNNVGSQQGQPGNKGALVKENQATVGSSKSASNPVVKNGDLASSGKGKSKAAVVMGPGSVNTNGGNASSNTAEPSKLLKTASGITSGTSSVKQEGLDSLRLSSGELGSKGKVTKDGARGSADFASVLAALNVDSIGGKGAGLGSAIGPNGLVGNANVGAGAASNLLLSRSGSSDSERSGKGSADEAAKAEEEGCIGDGSGSEMGVEDVEEAVVSFQAAKIEKKQEGEVPADEDVDESRKKDKKRGKNKRRRQKQKATNATAGGASGTSGAAPGGREFPLNITLHGQKTTEVEVGCICGTPKGFAHVMGCPYPFMSNMSNIQRKIKEQYDELVKANIAKSLTLAQVGRFTTCLVDAKNTIQHKSDIIQRRFTIVKSLLSKADKSNFDRLCGQIYGLEREQKQLEEDSIVYNRMQEQLKQSPAYQKMLEYGRTHFETLPKSGQLIEKADNEEQISFEELLAQEKKDAFWQKHSSRSSVFV